MPEERSIRLTETVKAGGCASKLSPAILDRVLASLPKQADANVLVGFEHSDDAGVYQIGPGTALVQTVDFFTPMVDDPYIFGQIAASNALSDIYAMGGRPITALAHVCFPAAGDPSLLTAIMSGGISKMSEARCCVIGGHSVRDEEIKFGYSVTGLIHPSQVLTNGGAKAGDRLLLTKSLGTGVICTAIKKGGADPAWAAAAIDSMTTLNKKAAEVLALRAEAREGHETGVHAVTDVTGFGLIAHAREMALASKVAIRLWASRIPFLAGAFECVRAGHIPAGLIANREFAECMVAYEAEVDPEIRTLLFDPQTAGGLLIAIAPSQAAELTQSLHGAGVRAIEVGEVLPEAKPLITVAA